MIPAERSHLHVTARSHPGMSGKNNEDRYAVSAYLVSEEDPIPSLLAIVSDGIGGHRAGEVAAEVAVETISQFVASSDVSQPQETLRQAIVNAGQAIYAQSENEDSQRGMGATCACAWIIDDRLYTATVGDSRIYLIRAGNIQQISIDHTWIQEALEKGALTPDEAQNHPNAHVIRRYLGSRQPVQPDLRLRVRAEETDSQSKANQGLPLLPGDQLLLCSDGLTDLVTDAEILETLANQASTEAALDTLIDLANRRGGHDNITIVTLQVPAEVRSTAPPVEPRRRPALSPTCLALSAAILLVAALTAGVLWVFFGRTPAVVDSTPTSTQINFPTFTPTSGPSVSPGGTPTGISETPATPVATTASSVTPAPGETLTPPAGADETAAAPQPSITPWPTNTLTP